MEANFAIEVEEGDFQREDLQNLLQDIQSVHPNIQVEIEEPQGAFPVPEPDPFTILLGLEASAQLIASLHAILSDWIEGGGDVDLLNADDLAKEYLVKHTRITRDQLELRSKSHSGDFIVYTFIWREDDSKHRLKINRNDMTKWEYEGE